MDTVSSARQEILLIFPTTIAFIRHQKWGVFYLLREIVQRQKVKVRILKTDNDVDIRSIKQAENAIATFLVVDRSSHLLWKYEMILKKLLMSH